MKHFIPGALALSAIAVSCLFVSCQDEDYGFTKEEITASVYGRNFETIYGKISPDQTWDFSSYNLNRLGLAGGPSYSAQTRAASSFSTIDKEFEVPSELSGWLDQNIPEHTNNKNNKGFTTDFQLIMPENEVLIIPIYQGEAGMDWNLMLSTNNSTSNSQLVWEKSSLFQVNEPYNGQVGETYTATLNFSDLSDGDADDSGNKNINFPLNSILSSAGFTPSDNEWFHIEISGLSNNANGTISGGGTNVGTLNFSGSLSYDVKNEDILKASEIQFVQWYPKNKDNTYNNNTFTVKITRYKQYTGWRDLSTYGKSNEANTINKQTKSKAIRITNDQIPAGTTFSLYLNIDNLDQVIWYDGDHGGNQTVRQHYASRNDMWSNNGQMVALPAIQNDATIGEKLQAALKSAFGETRTYSNLMILGCEDSDKNTSDDKFANNADCGSHGSDWDMNDVVFLVVGMGREHIIGNDDEIIKKRYMIEDLGSTWDFDFNDIVVDVAQIIHWKTDNGLRTDVLSTETSASLVHLCGTIPFSIKIGNTIMGASESNTSGKFPGNNAGSPIGGPGFDPRNDSRYNALQNVSINGWDPNTNNIYVTVWPKEGGFTFQDIPNIQNDPWTDNNLTTTSGSGYLGVHGVDAAQTFTFPQNGQYPFIIACDPSVNWTTESTLIPQNWFSTWKPNTNNGGDNTGDYIGGNTGGDTGGNTDNYTEDDNNGDSNTNILFEGNKQLEWNNWQIDNVKSGYTITIEYKASNAGQIQIFNGEWNNDNKKLNPTLTTDGQSHTLSFTAGGTWIVIQGQNCNITKITQ